MEPSNPNNNKPFIYRFLDSLGVAHLVVPMEHTHDITEITDLSDYIPVGIAGGNPGHYATVIIGSDGGVRGNSPLGFAFQVTGTGGGTLEITAQTIANLIRASTAPDSTPTANSDNLVKSGGVYAAIHEAVSEVGHLEAPNGDSEKYAAVWTEIDGDEGIVSITIKKDGEEAQTVTISSANFDNLFRALDDPDEEKVTEITLNSGTIDVTTLKSGHIYSCTPLGAGLAVKNYFSNVDQWANDKGETVNSNFVFRYIKAPFTNSLGQTNYTHIVDIISSWGGSPEPV